jgi:hypothetical protein
VTFHIIDDFTYGNVLNAAFISGPYYSLISVGKGSKKIGFSEALAAFRKKRLMFFVDSRA